MAQSTSPSRAVLLITGAWHIPEHYKRVTSKLEALGVRVICECLPTNNNVVPPNKTIDDDVQFIKDIVAKETAVGTNLTVVAHSWGGVVASAALAEFALQPGPDKAGVTEMIFMAAFIPAENQSLAGLFGGKLPPYLTSMPNDTIVWSDPIDHLFHDLTPEDAQRAESLCVAHGHTAQYTPIQCDKVSWRVIPLSYIICEDDRALPGFVQEMMVEKVKAEGITVREFRLAASHSPFLSVPGKVVDIILEVMGSQ
jgi:pimeloyl-ACP methyl ester carboxylesterase